MDKEVVFTKWDFIKVVILLVGITTASWFMMVILLSIGKGLT